MDYVIAHTQYTPNRVCLFLIRLPRWRAELLVTMLLSKLTKIIYNTKQTIWFLFFQRIFLKQIKSTNCVLAGPYILSLIAGKDIEYNVLHCIAVALVPHFHPPNLSWYVLILQALHKKCFCVNVYQGHMYLNWPISYQERRKRTWFWSFQHFGFTNVYKKCWMGYYNVTYLEVDIAARLLCLVRVS